MRFERLQTKKSLATIEMPSLFETFNHFDKSRSNFETALIRLKFRPGNKNMRNLSIRSDDLIFNFRECVADIVSGEADINRQADQLVSVINLENNDRASFIRELLYACKDTCPAPYQNEDTINELGTDVFTELVDNGKSVDIVSSNIADIFADYVLDDVRHFSNHLGIDTNETTSNDLRASIRGLGHYGLLATGIAATTVSLLQLIK